MQYFLILLSLPFIFFQYKIITSDIRKKIIPNKYLGYSLVLLPFYFFYIVSNFPEASFIVFIIQIFFAILLSFLLYYFGIWSAGDAKYLLVLALFLPHIGIIPFVGNIALVTIGYLLLYFVYFYGIKNVFHHTYRRSFLKELRNDIKEKYKYFIGIKNENQKKKDFYLNVIKRLSRFLLIFLIIFVSLRLSRLYIIEWFITEKSKYTGGIKSFVMHYPIYVVLLSFVIIVIIVYTVKFCYTKIQERALQGNMDYKKIQNYILMGSVCMLLGFILYEMWYNFETIILYLTRIFTLYLILYLIAQILLYSYKITFGIAEQHLKNIKTLESGDIVDKNYLIGMFGTQKVLGCTGNWEKNPNKKGLFYPSPINYFKNIENPIDSETCTLLKKAYKQVNQYHKKNKTPHFQEMHSIRVLSTFAFGPYIFLGFLLTYFFGNTLFEMMLRIIIEGIKSFYS